MTAQLDLPGMPRRLFSATPSKLGHLRRLPAPLPVHLRRPAEPARRARRGRTTPSARPCTPPCGRWWDLAGPAPHPGRGPPAALLRLVAQRLPRRRAGRPLARPGAGWVTDYVEGLDPADEPVGTERTVGATHRAAGAVGPGRPDRPARRRAGRSSTTRPAGRSAPTTTPADHRPWPPTCSASGARSGGRAAASSCTTCRAARWRPSSTPTGRWPTTSAGPRTPPTTSPRPPRPWPQARVRTTPFPPAPGVQCSWCDFRPHCPTGQAAARPRETWSFLADDD